MAGGIAPVPSPRSRWGSSKRGAVQRPASRGGSPRVTRRGRRRTTAPRGQVVAISPTTERLAATRRGHASASNAPEACARRQDRHPRERGLVLLQSVHFRAELSHARRSLLRTTSHVPAPTTPVPRSTRANGSMSEPRRASHNAGVATNSTAATEVMRMCGRSPLSIRASPALASRKTGGGTDPLPRRRTARSAVK